MDDLKKVVCHSVFDVCQVAVKGLEGGLVIWFDGKI